MKAVLFYTWFFLLAAPSVLSQNLSDFSKGGKVHNEVINLWDSYYRDYLASEIKKRLFENGDVYVLYDVQIGGLQSFVEMTRRCKDIRQIREVVDLLSPVLSELKPVPGADNSTGWICTGGNICTAYNFIGKEVQLCSSQFLGLLGAVATTVSEIIPVGDRTDKERVFLSQTFNTMAVQLDRWLNDGYFASVEKRLIVTPDDIKDGSSRYFFTDKDLWSMTILSDLSELYRSGIRPAAADGKDAFENLQRKKEGVGKIFDLFLARITLSTSSGGLIADLDRGFWRNYFDNRYAGYTGDLSPVSWEKKSNGEFEMKTRVAWDSSYIRPAAGWDISHSRRLVPALETFARNKLNIQMVWKYENPDFDPIAIRRAFANQIAEKIWNGSLEQPLFSNFWSGDNGWYRVAYAHHTGRQFAGYPPYGLSISIPDGGYPLWGTFHPKLKSLFRSIYQLSQTDDEQLKPFVAKYYPRLAARSSACTAARQVQSFSFLSDLVECP